MNLLISLIILSFLFSCKKLDLKTVDAENERTQKLSLQNSTLSSCDSTICEDCVFQEAIGEDTTEYPTILGNTYTNPYSIQVMTQAYNNIHGTNLQSVPTTHYYVRFKPDDSTDLNVLDSLDVELYDYPLDREVTQDGDYWPDAYTNLAPGEIPWLYTVVESGFQFPVGINYEILAPLNIPDDDPTLEDEAFNLTGNTECSSGTMAIQSTSTGRIQPNVADDCDPGFHWDPIARTCVRDDPPPPPPPTNLYPQGMISFHTYNDLGVVPQYAPLRHVRVVGRRFFKIDKTYTDANGNFVFSKRFPHKVTLIVKLRVASGYGSHTMRQETNGFGVWKRWFPLKKNIGTYKGKNLQNLNYVFKKGNKIRNWTTRRWLGCVALNTVLETNYFLSTHGLNSLHNKLNIYLAHPNAQIEYSTYRFIYNSEAPLEHVNGNFSDSHEPDIMLTWLTTDFSSLTTSKVTINVAQQLAIDYLYKITGNHHWNNYTNALSYGLNSSVPPFGPGPTYTANSQLLAIWQSFAQHLGHTIADRFFGTGEYIFELQGKTWASSLSSSSSSKYLEQFDPTIGPPSELFNWISVGLITDLMDNNVDPLPVVDNVSGFTYSDIQTALQADPTSMAAFKGVLKTIRPSQSTALDQLFTSYGY